MTPRFHTAVVGAKGRILIDGLEHLVAADKPQPPTVETLAPGLHILTIGLVCKEIHLEGDPVRVTEPTPIYDQLIAEQAGKEPAQ